MFHCVTSTATLCTVGKVFHWVACFRIDSLTAHFYSLICQFLRGYMLPGISTKRCFYSFKCTILIGCTFLREPGKATDEASLAPPTAKPKGIACTNDGESKQDKRVDDVIVHEYII